MTENKSLREWFAGMALQGLMSNWPNHVNEEDQQTLLERAGQFAWRAADATLEEKEDEGEIALGEPAPTLFCGQTNVGNYIYTIAKTEDEARHKIDAILADGQKRKYWGLADRERIVNLEYSGRDYTVFIR